MLAPVRRIMPGNHLSPPISRSTKVLPSQQLLTPALNPESAHSTFLDANAEHNMSEVNGLLKEHHQDGVRPVSGRVASATMMRSGALPLKSFIETLLTVHSDVLLRIIAFLRINTVVLGYWPCRDWKIRQSDRETTGRY